MTAHHSNQGVALRRSPFFLPLVKFPVKFGGIHAVIGGLLINRSKVLILDGPLVRRRPGQAPVFSFPRGSSIGAAARMAAARRKNSLAIPDSLVVPSVARDLCRCCDDEIPRCARDDRLRTARVRRRRTHARGQSALRRAGGGDAVRCTGAKVADLVDALDLGSSAARRGGSSPPFRTSPRKRAGRQTTATSAGEGRHPPARLFAAGFGAECPPGQPSARQEAAVRRDEAGTPAHGATRLRSGSKPRIPPKYPVPPAVPGLPSQATGRARPIITDQTAAASAAWQESSQCKCRSNPWAASSAA